MFAMVEGSSLNVVDRPISWQMGHAAALAKPADPVGQDIPLDVVYEDEHLIVIDKPSGVVVHPAPGNRHGTLVHGLLHRFRSFGSFNNVLRPGIVHRLDASTSGLLVVAREQGSGTRDTFLEEIMGDKKAETPGVNTVASSNAEVRTALTGSN